MKPPHAFGSHLAKMCDTEERIVACYSQNSVNELHGSAQLRELSSCSIDACILSHEQLVHAIWHARSVFCLQVK